MDHMRDHLSKAEIRKDAVQTTVEAAAGTVGQVATIITSAVKDVAGVLGGFATEVFEIRESARRASAEHSAPAPAARVPGAAAPGPRSTDEAVTRE